MASTAELLVNVVVNSTQATAAMSSFGSSIAKIANIATGVATGEILADVAASVVGEFKDAAEALDKYGQSVASIQRITGGSAESSSELLALFERFSPTIDDATGRLSKFEKALAGVDEQGNVSTAAGKKVSQTFAEFGVQTSTAGGQLRPTIDILLDLADGFQKSGDAAQKNLALTTLFGKGSQSLLLMLNQGRAGLTSFIEEAQREGLVLSQDNVADVMASVAAHKQMDMAMQAVPIQAGTVFMPIVTGALVAVAGLAERAATQFHNFATLVKEDLGGLGSLLGRAPSGVEATPDATSAAQISTARTLASATAASDAAKARTLALHDAAADRQSDFDLAHLASEEHLGDLKTAQAEAEANTLTYKRQIEDLDRTSVNFAQQRLTLEEQANVMRAEQAAAPLQAQSEELKFQEDLIRAKVAASRAGGPAVDMAAARSQMASLTKEGLREQPALLMAEHNTALANQAKSTTDLTAGLAANATAGQKLDITEASAPAALAASMATRAYEDSQRALDVDKQRFELSKLTYTTENLLAAAVERTATQTLSSLKTASATGAPGAEVATAASGPQMPIDSGVYHAHTAMAGGAVDPTMHSINVTVGNYAQSRDEVIAAVISALQAAWDAAKTGHPVVGQLGGAFTSAAGR